VVFTKKLQPLGAATIFPQEHFTATQSSPGNLVRGPASTGSSRFFSGFRPGKTTSDMALSLKSGVFLYQPGTNLGKTL
jgi:hypothetical protein